MEKNNIIMTCISRYLYLKKRWSSNFAYIIKTATMFIKTVFTDSKKQLKIRNYILKFNLCWYLLQRKMFGT